MWQAMQPCSAPLATLPASIMPLGFLSSVSKHEIAEAVKIIAKGDYTLDKRSLLQLYAPENLFGEINFALNYITIYRNATPALIIVHVFVDDLLHYVGK